VQAETVLISGHFNVLHPGHLRLLRFAKECGDRLLVAVESDRLAGRAAYISEQLRLEGVATNSYVDEAFLIDSPVVEVIRKLRPNVVVKGKEHEDQENPELEALAEYGGKLLFSSGESIFSSIDLIRREFMEVSQDAIRLPTRYMARNEIRRERLSQICELFKELRVTVLGDLIIDEYITCQPLGMSQEEPTIVVTPIDYVRFVGGAGIVAAHAAGLGAKVDFVSVSGADSARAFAIDKLLEYGVRTHIFEDGNRPTTLKQRYRSKGKSLLRVSHLHQDAISREVQISILDTLPPLVSESHLLVFSDFNYGCLPQQLVDAVISMARKNNVLITADSQSSSQVGDISRFHGLDLITPTEREARVSTRNHEDGLVVLAEKLRKQSRAKNVLLKLGEEGVLVHALNRTNADENGIIQTDQIPAMNTHPKDVAGAGDSMLITTSMALACGANIMEASLLGSLASAIQVGRIGNSPLQIAELVHHLQQQNTRVSTELYPQ
jgi:rfaE bifunctional protein kinase chain/domain